MNFFSSAVPVQSSDADWMPLPEEGQLSVDVFRSGNHLVIRAPIAGVRLEDIDIAIDSDLLTVRGKREIQTEQREDDWYYKECYWGSFSRSIVLPIDVYAEQADATIQNGILEIRIPVREQSFRVAIQPRDS
ncbi:MAG: Hsp20/alpha crystallin family protein [bacterium]|nr:Hsp20/alpha crystallin family protein [bacterium]